MIYVKILDTEFDSQNQYFNLLFNGDIYNKGLLQTENKLLKLNDKD